MAVYEFKVEILPGAVPAIEELLGEREVQHLMVLEDKPAARAWLMGYFEAIAEARTTWTQFSEQLDPAWVTTPPTISELPDQDWKESYKEHFKAWKFGPLNWVPVWERETFRAAPGEEVLWLDPGMAFGTGNHETTRLVVERMVTIVAQRGTGGLVIDAGCGSGILALSAAKLGFHGVTAFDNDPLAVEVSRENAALNGLADRVNFYVGDLVTGLAGRQAELVLANIQADVLMKFAPHLRAAVAPGGALVMSGILAGELAQVRECFSAVAPGWHTEDRTMGEWSELLLVAPGR